jgi:hypothetical protein
MNTRITVDLQDPQMAKMLRLKAAQEGKAIREVIVDALQSYFSHTKENQAVLKLAEKTFEEWNSPEDAVYDRL